MEETVPFNVNEEVVVADLDVKKDRPVLPVTQNVLVKIAGGEIRKDRVEPKNPESDWTYAYLNLNLELVDGITVDGEQKYKGMRVFTGKLDLGLAHNPQHKTGRWWDGRQYAIGTKALITALGFDPKQPPKFNDEFIGAIKDRQLLVDILQEEIRTKSEDGDWVGTGEFKNRITGFKPFN